MLSSRICKLASTLLVGMSCSSSNLCSAHALLDPLEATVKDLRAQLLAAQEAQRVPEKVSRFLATTAEVQLQQPEITGLAVPMAFALHVPVQRNGEC